MKKNKILITILSILTVCLIVFLLIMFFINKNISINLDSNINKGNNIQNEKEGNEEFSVNLSDETDHYLLTIKTNIIKNSFVFKYDKEKFILDTSSILFDEAIINNEENNFRKIDLNLESNKLYKFYFIKKTETKMELGKNLIIE